MSEPHTAEIFRSGTVRDRPQLALKLRAYWVLIKDLQTGLLVITGLAGYMSGRPDTTWQNILTLLGSL
ncbi:MAG: hypothetical protein ACP5GX_07690, partial [Anaerolineae bacterium]